MIADDIEETELDEVQLRLCDLAEIFILYGLSPLQALEFIKENYPVMHLELLSESDPDTLH